MAFSKGYVTGCSGEGLPIGWLDRMQPGHEEQTTHRPPVGSERREAAVEREVVDESCSITLRW